MGNKETLDTKLIELETKFSFQEDLLQSLDEVVTRQQADLEKLNLQVKHLQAQLQELAETPPAASQGSLEDEKPPHY